MKVGLSYGRCILDIHNGVVDINDVLVIITRTHFDPENDDQWKGIWQHYCFDWSKFEKDNADEEVFRALTLQLHRTGKLHQPRKFGTVPETANYYWLETVLPSFELEKNPMAKKAWEQFQTVAGLTNVTLDKTYR